MKLILLFLLISFTGFCQKKPLFDFTKIQRGPYVGFQQGRNIVLELGFEKRIKEVKWRSPNAHAFNIGANYDYKAGLLGADAGYWFRPNRISFTFGAQAAVRSDFDRAMIGFTPTIGYKIWLLHANAGFYIYPKAIPGVQTNNLFIQLRLVLTEKSTIKNNNK
jgi:hypothetical protein